MESLNIQKREAFLYWNLGSWYEARNRIADAEKTYRKGCELHTDVEESPRSSAPMSGLAACYQHLALLLDRLDRQAESVQVLERGIVRLEKLPQKTKGQWTLKAESLDGDICKMKELLGREYVFSGKRDKAVSLITAESKRRPITLRPSTRGSANLFNLLGMEAGSIRSRSPGRVLHDSGESVVEWPFETSSRPSACRWPASASRSLQGTSRSP